MPGGSGRGYHFLSEWRTCPRKWFLHNVAGLESTDKRPATVMGTIIHYLQERLYIGDYADLEYAYSDEIIAICSEHRSAWFEDDDYNEAVSKIIGGFMTWRKQFGYADTQNWDLIGAEMLFEHALPNGRVVSGLVDQLFRDNTDGHFILKDTKTTSWGPETAHKKVEQNDQVTMYTWLIQKQYGFVPVEMIPDIMYMKPRVPTCHRFGSIHRSPSDIETFIWGLCHDTDQMVRDLGMYWDGCAPPEYLFPRNATVCSEFGCEYESICRAKFDETTPPPATGFEKNIGLTVETLFKEDLVDSQPIKG